MTRDEIHERICSFIAEHFELDASEVTAEAKFVEDLGLDSIDAVELALHLGEMTNATIREDALREIVTISDVVDLVVKLQAEGASEAAATESAEPAKATNG